MLDFSVVEASNERTARIRCATFFAISDWHNLSLVVDIGKELILEHNDVTYKELKIRWITSLNNILNRNFDLIAECWLDIYLRT